MLPRDQMSESTNKSGSDNDNAKHLESKKEGDCRSLNVLPPTTSVLHTLSFTSPANSATSPGSSVSSPTSSLMTSPPKLIWTSPKSPSSRKQENVQGQTGTSSMPVHCVVEFVNRSSQSDSSSHAQCDITQVVKDDFAILPGATLFSDLIRTSLITLGFTDVDVTCATGAVELKNWKPLSFDSISDNKEATVADILGDLNNKALLRIRVTSRPKVFTAEEMRDVILKLLLTQSHGLLEKSGCPFGAALLMSISKGECLSDISEEEKSAFCAWYKTQVKKNNVDSLVAKGREPFSQDSPKDSSNSVIEKGASFKIESELQDGNSDSKTSPKLNIMPSSFPSSPSSLSLPSSAQLPVNTSGHQHHHHHHQGPHSHGMIITPSKTRIRTSFDPEHEIPRLQKWFQDNQHPSREQMVRFMTELNNLESRKGRRPLDLTNIIYWFKNARAAQRRATKALDDSFESEESGEINGHLSENAQVPYLPNKNAVYMIPIPVASTSPHPHFLTPSADMMSDSYDEPCDLSVKRGKDMSPNSSDSGLAVVSKDKRLENNVNGVSCKLSNSKNGTSAKSFMKNYMHEVPNGSRGSLSMNGLSTMHENFSPRKLTSSFSKEMRANGQHGRHFLQKQVRDDEDVNRDDSLILNLKQERISDDDNNSVNSDDSDASRLKIHEEDDESDYSSSHRRRGSIDDGFSPAVSSAAMVAAGSVSSAASMAALSLAQMSQPLHIPQLTPQLAAMYYSMTTPRYFPPPPSHHHHQAASSAATAAMVAALNGSHLNVGGSTNGGSNGSVSHHGSTGHHIPIQPAPHPPLPAPHLPNRGGEPRKRRTRVFIDPLTEIPKLEKWFLEDTHPSAYMIDKYTEALNAAEYRQKFPNLEPKNVQLWFKNHRAKVKRMRAGLEESFCDSPQSQSSRNSPNHTAGKEDEREMHSPEPVTMKEESLGDVDNGHDNDNNSEFIDEDAQ